MINQGFGSQGFGSRGVRAPSPQQMGAALAQQSQQQPAPGGLPTLGVPSMMGGMGADGMDPMDPTGAMAMQMGAMGYDPSNEHSESSTKAALEDAIRRAKDTGRRPQLERAPAPNQRWQLATLGLPPLEIDLFTRTGDAAGGVG